MASYKLQQVNPARQRIALAVLSVIALAIVASAFWFGYNRSNTNADDLENRIESLNEQLTEARKNQQNLMEEKAMLQRSNELDKAAMQTAKDELAAMQLKQVTLKEELTFYKSLLSPEDRQPGVNIRSLELEPMDENGGYKYTLVLMQVRQNNIAAKGKVTLSAIKRTQDSDEDSAEELDAEDPELLEELDVQAFQFTFFQRIEGVLIAPENRALPLLVSVKPDGRRLQPVTQIYDWNTLIGGSN